jgi:hypothetical protein
VTRQQRRHVSSRYPLCHVAPVAPVAAARCAPRWDHWRAAWCPNGLRRGFVITDRFGGYSQ